MRQLKRPRRSALRAPRERKVLAICGDTQVGLWMVRSLARGGLRVFSICRSEHGQAAHSTSSAGAWASMLGARDPQFLDEIYALARELGVGSIMTIAESYHGSLIENRDRFEPEFHVFSPPAECFAKATDKDFMQTLCRELGVPVAQGMRLDELMAAGGDGLQFPLVLRTSKQNDSDAGKAPWKAAYAETPEDLRRLHGQVEGFADNVIVQEYHPGVEDHVQILMHNGECFAAGEYIGEHHMPLAGGVTVQRVSCRHPKLIAHAVELLQAIGWEGIAGVQFHYDPATDKYIFLEINPRFIGGLPTVVMAGFSAPYLLWQTHYEPDRMRRPTYKLGMRTRILGGDANWMFGMMRGDQLPPGQSRLGKLSAIGQFLWNTGPWTHDDSFLLRDPKPFFVDLRQMVKKFGSQAFDIIGNPESQESGA